MKIEVQNKILEVLREVEEIKLAVTSTLYTTDLSDNQILLQVDALARGLKSQAQLLSDLAYQAKRAEVK